MFFLVSTFFCLVLQSLECTRCKWPTATAFLDMIQPHTCPFWLNSACRNGSFGLQICVLAYICFNILCTIFRICFILSVVDFGTRICVLARQYTKDSAVPGPIFVASACFMHFWLGFPPFFGCHFCDFQKFNKAQNPFLLFQLRSSKWKFFSTKNAAWFASTKTLYVGLSAPQTLFFMHIMG